MVPHTPDPRSPSPSLPSLPPSRLPSPVIMGLAGALEIESPANLMITGEARGGGRGREGEVWGGGSG